MTAAPLDVAAARARLPALAGEALFLDGPAGSQVPATVIEAVAGALRDGDASAGWPAGWRRTIARSGPHLDAGEVTQAPGLDGDACRASAACITTPATTSTACCGAG
jgi:hypothetical protein